MITCWPRGVICWRLGGSCMRRRRRRWLLVLWLVPSEPLAAGWVRVAAGVARLGVGPAPPCREMREVPAPLRELVAAGAAMLEEAGLAVACPVREVLAGLRELVAAGVVMLAVACPVREVLAVVRKAPAGPVVLMVAVAGVVMLAVHGAGLEPESALACTRVPWRERVRRRKVTGGRCCIGSGISASFRSVAKWSATG